MAYVHLHAWNSVDTWFKHRNEEATYINLI